MVLDGKALADQIKVDLKARVERQMTHGARDPKLAIIQVGDNPASNTYVKLKCRDCNEIGITPTLFKFSADTGYLVSKLRDLIEELNRTITVDGIIVQLPLEGLGNDYYQQRVLEKIDIDKDVDGLRPDVFAKLNVPYYNPYQSVPCTPHGILMLLDHYKIPLEDAGVVIVGRSQLVGRPLAQMMTNRNANVCLLHSKTHPDVIWTEMRQSKIIVSAVGQPHIWDPVDMLDINEQQVVIDVGTSMLNGHLVGDFCWDYLDHFGGIEKFDFTPVPGGVGPMTRAALMTHVVEAYEHHLKERGEYYDRT